MGTPLRDCGAPPPAALSARISILRWHHSPAPSITMTVSHKMYTTTLLRHCYAASYAAADPPFGASASGLGLGAGLACGSSLRQKLQYSTSSSGQYM